MNYLSPVRTSDKFIGMLYQTPGVVPTQLELCVRALNSLHNETQTEHSYIALENTSDLSGFVPSLHPHVM